MKTAPLLTLAVLAAGSALAEETRQLDSHEHGVGQLNIAFDGNQIAMELHAPGADIVGFEYEAESAEDLAAIDAAIASLAQPLDLFVMSDAAGCTVVEAVAELESEEHHDEHAEGEDHDHDAEDGDHDNGDHAEEAGHTEFHAEYLLECAEPSAVSEITFAYFETFPKALEVEVQLLTEDGANGFEVERDEPILDVDG